MKKYCELCRRSARICCESDQASLCWDCDNKVHAANFLVEKHVRHLLCHVCQAPTLWSGSGPKLCNAVSICDSCLQCNKNETLEDEEVESQSSSSEEEEYHDSEGENQVVPWPSTPPPPVPESSEEECSSEIHSLKRSRDRIHDLEDETNCSSSISKLYCTPGVNGGDDETREIDGCDSLARGIAEKRRRRSGVDENTVAGR